MYVIKNYFRIPLFFYPYSQSSWCHKLWRTYLIIIFYYHCSSSLPSSLNKTKAANAADYPSRQRSHAPAHQERTYVFSYLTQCTLSYINKSYFILSLFSFLSLSANFFFKLYRIILALPLLLCLSVIYVYIYVRIYMRLSDITMCHIIIYQQRTDLT